MLIVEECLVIIVTGMLSVDGRGMFGCYGDCRNAECWW